MMSRVAWWKKLTTQQKIYIILHCLSLALSPFHMNFWFFIFVKCVTLFSKTQQLRQQLSSPSTVNSANKHIFMLFRCKIFAPFSCVGGWNRWRKYSTIFKIAVIIKNDISQLGERRKKKFLIFRHVIDCWCSGVSRCCEGCCWEIHEKCFPIFSSVLERSGKKEKNSNRNIISEVFEFICWILLSSCAISSMLWVGVEVDGCLKHPHQLECAGGWKELHEKTRKEKWFSRSFLYMCSRVSIFCAFCFSFVFHCFSNCFLGFYSSICFAVCFYMFLDSFTLRLVFSSRLVSSSLESEFVLQHKYL